MIRFAAALAVAFAVTAGTAHAQQAPVEPDVLVLGDSLTVQARAVAEWAAPFYGLDLVVDAANGWSLPVHHDTAIGTDASTLVLALGVNDANWNLNHWTWNGWTDPIDAWRQVLADADAEGRCVVVVQPRAGRHRWIADWWARVLPELQASGAHVYPWGTYAEWFPQWFLPDDTHLTTAGAWAYGLALDAAAATCN